MIGLSLLSNQFMNDKPIQVFEYEKLYVDDRFTRKHFNKLVQYNDKNGSKFFTVGYNYIVFKQYVGVIQIGKLVIEILPKADSSFASQESAKSKWQTVLFQMLRFCKYIKLESLSSADLKIRSASLVDLYFESFIEEVESLIHRGLTKKYRNNEDNIKFLKGKLIFSKNISKNLIHQERFFTEHQVYDSDHLIHQIIKKGLRILTTISARPYIVSECQRLLMYFENVKDITVNENIFEKITLNRKTEHYQSALLLAKMIILNYSPDLIAGDNHILTILFDMNKLYEKYVFLLLKKWEDEFLINILGQTNTPFWENKGIKPDIIIEPRNSSSKLKKIIVDTKWKILYDLTPSDVDLKQMYVYNMQFNAEKSILLYPKFQPDLEERKGVYRQSSIPSLSKHAHSCHLYFLDLFNEEEKLNKEVGKEFLTEIQQVTNGN